MTIRLCVECERRTLNLSNKRVVWWSAVQTVFLFVKLALADCTIAKLNTTASSTVFKRQQNLRQIRSTFKLSGKKAGQCSEKRFFIGWKSLSLSPFKLARLRRHFLPPADDRREYYLTPLLQCWEFLKKTFCQVTVFFPRRLTAESTCRSPFAVSVHTFLESRHSS